MRSRVLKKGQLQVQETILVVFVFVIILIIGMAFFLRYQNQAIVEENKDYQREQFSLIITSLPQYAEIKCSEYGQKQACIDTAKLTAFSVLEEESFPELGFKTITVSSIYPEKNTNVCNTRSSTECGVWELYTKKPASIDSTLKAVTPIALYYPHTRSYGIGLLEVEAYNL